MVNGAIIVILSLFYSSFRIWQQNIAQAAMSDIHYVTSWTFTITSKTKKGL